MEHVDRRAAAIVAERKLVGVALQVAAGNAVVRPVNRPFHLAPKAFDSVRMHSPASILFQAVAHAGVVPAFALEAVVGAVLVCHHLGRLLRRHGKKVVHRLGVGLADHKGGHAAVALHRTNHDGLACRATAPLALPLAANIGFIKFNGASEWGEFLGHQLTNLVHHAPRGLVRHSDLPLQLKGRHAVLAGGHQVDGMEPRLEAGGALVEHRTGGGVDLEGAHASVGPATGNGMETVVLAALGAGQAAVEAGRKDVRQAGGVIGKLTGKVFDRVFGSLEGGEFSSHHLSYALGFSGLSRGDSHHLF